VFRNLAHRLVQSAHAIHYCSAFDSRQRSIVTLRSSASRESSIARAVLVYLAPIFFRQVKRMIGRVGERRAASVKPAWPNEEARPT